VKFVELLVLKQERRYAGVMRVKRQSNVSITLLNIPIGKLKRHIPVPSAVVSSRRNMAISINNSVLTRVPINLVTGKVEQRVMHVEERDKRVAR